MTTFTRAEQDLDKGQEVGRREEGAQPQRLLSGDAGRRQLIRRKVFSLREPGRNQRVVSSPLTER